MHTEDKLVRLFEYSYLHINEGYLESGNSTFLVVRIIFHGLKAVRMSEAKNYAVQQRGSSFLTNR